MLVIKHVTDLKRESITVGDITFFVGTVDLGEAAIPYNLCETLVSIEGTDGEPNFTRYYKKRYGDKVEFKGDNIYYRYPGQKRQEALDDRKNVIECLKNDGIEKLIDLGFVFVLVEE